MRYRSFEHAWSRILVAMAAKNILNKVTDEEMKDICKVYLQVKNN